MFDFVLARYLTGEPWESARDAVYQRYQVEQADGYDMSSRDLYCNGCFAAGINFAASLVSLFYGEGDFRETTKIAVLCGWDSDNPGRDLGWAVSDFRWGQRPSSKCLVSLYPMAFISIRAAAMRCPQ